MVFQSWICSAASCRTADSPASMRCARPSRLSRDPWACSAEGCREISRQNPGRKKLHARFKGDCSHEIHLRLVCQDVHLEEVLQMRTPHSQGDGGLPAVRSSVL